VFTIYLSFCEVELKFCRLYEVDVKEESEKNTKIFEALYSRVESCEYLSSCGVSDW
jgi:hypothetical protein